MSRRRLIFYTIALAALFGAYVAYRFYENRAKSTPAAKAFQFDANEGFESTNRAFLQRAGFASQLPREVAKRFPSLKPPVWVYTTGEMG